MYSKTVKKRLKQLAAEAHEKELRSELKLLAEQFRLWEEEKIDVWGLEEAIHKFHNGPARKLNSRYTGLPPETVVPYALAKGLVSFDDIPQEVAEEMKFRAEYYK